MSSYALPFPGRDLAEKELSYDPCCPRIPEADRARIVDASPSISDRWTCGRSRTK